MNSVQRSPLPTVPGPDKKEILTGYTALFASDAVAKRLVGEFDAAGLLDTANYPQKRRAARRDGAFCPEFHGRPLCEGIKTPDACGKENLL